MLRANSRFFTTVNSGFVILFVLGLAVSQNNIAGQFGKGGKGDQDRGATCPQEVFDMNRSYIDAEVERVVDGDTVKIIFNGESYSIRMLSMDTWETHFQGKSQGEWGEKGTISLARMVKPGEVVRIELDRQRCDKYGRILGYVWKGKVQLNYLQLQLGMAVNYCIYPNIKYCSQFGAAVLKAMQDKVGVWGSDPSTIELPYDWRRRQRGEPLTKLVGRIDTRMVYQPQSQNRIPIPLRIFFMKPEHVQPPFEMAQ
jgi:endonuclease YncB( thermonuclease family)